MRVDRNRFALASCPVDGEIVNYAAIGIRTDRGNGAAKRSDQGPHGRAAVGQIVLPEQARPALAGGRISCAMRGQPTRDCSA